MSQSKILPPSSGIKNKTIVKPSREAGMSQRAFLRNVWELRTALSAARNSPPTISVQYRQCPAVWARMVWPGCDPRTVTDIVHAVAACHVAPYVHHSPSFEASGNSTVSNGGPVKLNAQGTQTHSNSLFKNLSFKFALMSLFVRKEWLGYPCNRSRRPRGLWDVEVPIFSRPLVFNLGYACPRRYAKKSFGVAKTSYEVRNVEQRKCYVVMNSE
jgi:hypothetical protein